MIGVGTEKNREFKKFIIDFRNVFCFRKVASEEEFNFKVYNELLKRNFISIIGKRNYSYLRIWHFDKLTKEFVSKKNILETEFEIEKKYLYLNPYILPYLENYQEIYIYNNTDYSNERISNIICSLTDDFSYKKIKITNSLETLINNEKDLYITSKTQTETTEDKRIFDYSFSIQNKIDLESKLYNEYEQKFYLLRKAMSLNPVCKDEYFKIGCLYLGPALFIFTKLVVDDLKKKNISLILPLMREGELLDKIFKLYLKERDNSISSKKFYVSRKSTFIPSLYEDHDVYEIWRFFEGVNLSIHDLYNIFDLKDIDSKLIHHNIFKIKELDSDEYLRIKSDFILKMKNLDFEKYIVNKRELILNYISEIVGEQKEETIATIDIGFNGTIQENLEKISDSFKYEHYLLFGREGLLKKLIAGIHVNSYVNSSDFDFVKDILRATHAFEQIVIGMEGSTLDYEVSDNEVFPKQEKLKYEEAEIIARREIHEGACYFVNLALQVHLDDDLNFNDLVNSAKSLHRLLNFPTKQEALAIGKLHYSTNFGSTEFNPIMNEKEICHYNVRDVYNSIKGSNLSSDIIWPQGVLALKDPSYVYKNLIETDLKDIFSKIKFILEISEGSDIVIYGAGEVANKVYRTLNIRSLKPLYFVDKNPKLHHTKIEGIKIIGPNELVDITVKYIIIASYTFAEEIEKDLMELYQDKEIHPILVRID